MTFAIVLGAAAAFFLAATFTFASAGWRQAARVGAVTSVLLALGAGAVAIVGEVRYQDCQSRNDRLVKEAEQRGQGAIIGFLDTQTCSRSLFR